MLDRSLKMTNEDETVITWSSFENSFSDRTIDQLVTNKESFPRSIYELVRTLMKRRSTNRSIIGKPLIGGSEIECWFIGQRLGDEHSVRTKRRWKRKSLVTTDESWTVKESIVCAITVSSMI